MKRKYKHSKAYLAKKAEKDEQALERELKDQDSSVAAALCKLSSQEELLAACKDIKGEHLNRYIQLSPLLSKKLQEALREARGPGATGTWRQVNDLTSVLARERGEHAEQVRNLTTGIEVAKDRVDELVEQLAKTRWELAKAAMLVDLLSDEVCHLREDLKKK